MQSQIPRLNNTNRERILAESLRSNNRKSVLCALKDVITLMPHKSLLVSSFIDDLVKEDPGFKEEIVSVVNEISSTSHVDHLVSAAFTIKQLGFSGTDVFDWVGSFPVLENPPFVGFELLSPSKEILDGSRKEVEEIRKVIGTADFEGSLYAVHIIKNFGFSIQECLLQLSFVSDQMQLVNAIRAVHNKDNVLYLSALVLELSRRQGFLAVLFDELPLFDVEFKDVLLSLLFEHFYEPGEESGTYANNSYIPLRSEEETRLFRGLMTEDTVRRMNRISNSSKVQKVVHGDIRSAETKTRTITKEEFEATDFEDKDVFFRNFCLLGSPSVSHFLTYLEMYKEHFLLDKEDQRRFLAVFLEMFSSAESFKRIVLGKMVLFEILDETLVSELEN